MNSPRITTALAAATLAGLFGSASALAQTAATSTFATMTVDGDFSDWAAVPVVFAGGLANIGPGSGGRLDFSNVKVANDADYLYISYTLHAAIFVDWRTTIWINGDTADTNGFFSEGQAWKFRVIEGAGFQTVRANEDGASQFNDGAMDITGYQFTGGTRAEVELRISLDTFYASALHPVDSVANSYFNQSAFPNETLTFRLVGNSVDSIADTTGVISYTLASIPEPSAFAALAGFGVLGLAATRRRRA